MKTRKTLILTAFTLSVLQLMSANVWYVRFSTGDDTTGDGSLSNPWKTLSGAYVKASVLTGDTLNVSGTFNSDCNITFSKSIVIHGTDKTSAVFDGTGLNSYFGKITSANSGKTLSLENVTIKNYNAYVSSAISQGGVIAILGTGSNVTLRNCVFKSNSATQGGAIHLANTSTNTASSLTIQDCHFDSNSAKATTSGTIYAGQGGAININANAYTFTIQIDRCLFESNSADTGSGSAISYVCTTSSTSNTNLTVQNSTFYGNQLLATSGTTNRGCIYLQPATSYGSAKLINNTIAFNTSSNSTQFAGVFVNNSNVTLINNILFGNTYRSIANNTGILLAESRNNITDVTSSLYNWTTKTATGMYSGNTNAIANGSGVGLLGLSETLAYNGGATKTLALSNNSVAINSGYTTGVPVVDQRNISRSAPDAGAFESVTYRSKGTGNWNNTSSWQSSGNNSIWYDVTVIPTANVSSLVSIQNGHEITITANATSPVLTINSGGKLTLNSAYTLGITGDMNIYSDINGTGTFIDKATNGGLTINGTSTIQQYLGAARNWYVCSPINNATSPSTNITRYYEYVEPGDNADFSVTGSTVYWKGLNTGTTMAIGKGYIAQASAGTTVQFSGTANNGDIMTTFDLTRNDAKGKGFNLVGNPYPSYLDWVDVAAANPNLDNTYYYRTKNSLDAYTFVTWNGAGSSYVVSNGSLPVNSAVTRYIPPTQAFWVRVKTGTSATKMNFTNAMREHRDDNGNLIKAPKQLQVTSLRLRLFNGTESDELLIYQNADANNNYDAYDSPKMINNSTTVPDLYSKVNDERLVINGLNTITDNMEIPLGFGLNAASTLKFKVSELNNLPEGTGIYLLDKVANTQTELTSETEYSFTTTTATSNNESRFSLVFRTKESVSALNNMNIDDSILIYCNSDNQISINSVGDVDDVFLASIYNSIGEKLFTQTINNSKTVLGSHFKSGIYIVTVMKNGKQTIKKITVR